MADLGSSKHPSLLEAVDGLTGGVPAPTDEIGSTVDGEDGSARDRLDQERRC